MSAEHKKPRYMLVWGGLALLINGTLMVAGSSMLPFEVTGQAAMAAMAPSYYPPARTALRGSHPGSFEHAHGLAWNGRSDWGPTTELSELYDLVVVGGGRPRQLPEVQRQLGDQRGAVLDGAVRGCPQAACGVRRDRPAAPTSAPRCTGRRSPERRGSAPLAHGVRRRAEGDGGGPDSGEPGVRRRVVNNGPGLPATKEGQGRRLREWRPLPRIVWVTS